MKLPTTNTPARLALLLGLLATATACGGGGGQGGGGALGALTTSGQLGAVSTRDASVDLRSGLERSGLGSAITLALDPSRDAFYTHDVRRQVLVRLGLDGAIRVIGQEDAAPVALTFDTTARRLLGVRLATGTRGELCSIDAITGRLTSVGPCALVRCITHDAANDTLLAVGSAGNQGVLYTIDPTTGISRELETSFGLSGVVGLAMDPMTRTLYGIKPSGGSLVTIDLMTFQVTEVASFTGFPKIHDIAFDADSGRLFGLTAGSELVELAGTWPAGELRRRAALGRVFASLTHDPRSGRHFGVDASTNELVSVDPKSGDVRPIGDLTGFAIDSLVYDPALDELHGIDRNTNRLVEIGTADASVTPVAGATFLYRADLAIDPQTGTIHGYERERDVSLRVDPHAPLASDRIVVAQTSIFGVSDHSLIVEDLAYDPSRGQIVAVGTLRRDEGGGSFSFQDVLTRFDPGQRFSLRLSRYHLEQCTAIARIEASGSFTVAQSHQPLVEMTFGFDLESARTVGGPWDLAWDSAVRVPGQNLVYAVADRSVYRVDPTSGEATWLGAQPTGFGAQDVLYDATTGRLGLRFGQRLAWVDPARPDVLLEEDAVTNYHVLTGDPATPGTLFGLKDGGLFRLDVASGISAVLTPSPLPGILEETASFDPATGRIHVVTRDRRLFEVDSVTGEWTEVGPLELGVRALWAN